MTSVEGLMSALNVPRDVAEAIYSLSVRERITYWEARSRLDAARGRQVGTYPPEVVGPPAETPPEPPARPESAAAARNPWSAHGVIGMVWFAIGVLAVLAAVALGLTLVASGITGGPGMAAGVGLLIFAVALESVLIITKT